MARISNRGVLCVATAVICAMPLRAQSPLSAEVGIGTASVSGGDYYDRRQMTVSGDLGLRVLAVQGVELLVGASALQYYGENTFTVAPTCFGCITSNTRAVPEFGFFGATVTGRLRLNAATTVSAQAGLGQVHMLLTHGIQPATSWRVDVAARIVGPLQFVFGGRILSWTQGGNTLYAYPITFGVRLN